MKKNDVVTLIVAILTVAIVIVACCSVEEPPAEEMMQPLYRFTVTLTPTQRVIYITPTASPVPTGVSDEVWDWFNEKPDPTATTEPTATPTQAPTLTPTPEPEPIPESDRELLAQVMYWENYDNGVEAMLLTGSVVLNRVKSGEWGGDTIKKVIYAKGQYSTTGYFYTKTIPDEVYSLAEKLLTEGSMAPENVVYQAMFKQGSGVYKQVGTDYFCYE